MRVLRSSDWKYLGTEGEYFKFEDRREGLDGGTLLLTQCTKYVVCGCDIVLMLEWKNNGKEKSPSISLTYSSYKRILANQVVTTISDLERYLSSLGFPADPLANVTVS